ncbi:MAG: DUF2911 domain-containing protein [Gemmatimonadales bacterium]|nr:DUF2911 domain-containing protein [Gemmatimonadales bacterium]
MKRVPFLLVLGSLTAAPLVAQRPSSGAFVIRLGRDTSAVEKYTRTATRIEGDALGRAPRTVQRHYTMDFGPDGRPTRIEVVATRPGAPANTPPIQRTLVTFTRDSAVVEVRRDTAVTRRIAMPAGVIPIRGGAAGSWLGFDLLAARLKQSLADSISAPVYSAGGTGTQTWSAKRLGRDSVWIYDNNNVFHASIDRDGRITGAVPLSGTQQFTVTRVVDVNIAALGPAFAARDDQGQGVGALSTRDTVRSTVGGATLWIDYGRPAKRGRVLFGSTIVPWGEVWRTGANAATQFRTDRDLDIGGVRLPAGPYTLWTIPSQSGWKLLINSETGQWGTAHRADRDIFQLDMRSATLPQPVERFTISIVPDAQGGVLRLQWDTTEASIPFTAR